MKMKLLATSLCAAAAMSVLSVNVQAQSTVTAYAGATSVTLSSTFVSALTELSVKVGQVNPTMVSGAVATFPIETGVIDRDTAKGNLIHSGCLTFSSGNTTVRLQDFIIDTTGSMPVITGVAVVDNKVVGRLPLFDLTLPTGFSLPVKTHGNTLALTGVKVMLDAKAASALNSVYGVSQFTAGLSIGTANVTAYVSSSDWTY
jgi:hypothetical protein